MSDTQKIIMVSGGSGGIGRAIVERLTGSGMIVSAGLRNPSSVGERPRLKTHFYDAESLESAVSWVSQTILDHGRVDAIVNAAATNPMFRLLDADETALDQMWRVNVKGPLRLTRLLFPHFEKQGGGKIINLSSLASKRIRGDNIGYSMTKFAVTAMTHGARKKGWDANIRATALCPGYVETEMTSHITDLPRAEMSKPEEIAILVEQLIHLHKTSSIAELVVNCRPEDMF